MWRNRWNYQLHCKQMQQTSREGLDSTRLGRKINSREIAQKIEFRPHYKMVYAETRICILNAMHKILWDFQRETDPQFPGRKSELVIINKKRRKKRKRTCHQQYFAVPANCRVKVKESEKINQYLDLARELKSCGTCGRRWKQLHFSVLGMIPKGNETVGNQKKNRNHSTRKDLETGSDLISLRFQ